MRNATPARSTNGAIYRALAAHGLDDGLHGIFAWTSLHDLFIQAVPQRSDVMRNWSRRVADLARPSIFFGALIARGHTGDYLQRLGRNLDAEASTQHEDLDERSAPFLFSRCLLQTASCVNSRSRLFDNL
jgi:hypothetical protein